MAGVCVLTAELSPEHPKPKSSFAFGDLWIRLLSLCVSLHLCEGDFNFFQKWFKSLPQC